MMLGQIADSGAVDAVVTPELLRQVEDDPDGVRRAFRDDRSRSRVSKLLRRTIAQLDDASPTIGRHLAATVSTGHLCSYTPMLQPSLRWQT